MKFGVYQNDKGDYYASIEIEGAGGSILDMEVCASKEEAMVLRDKAANANAASFDAFLDRAAKKKPGTFDHDGDGKPGGSKPKGKKS